LAADSTSRSRSELLVEKIADKSARGRDTGSDERAYHADTECYHQCGGDVAEQIAAQPKAETDGCHEQADRDE
jgi:hypothetical protein